MSTNMANGRRAFACLKKNWFSATIDLKWKTMNIINDYESKIIENWPNLQKSCQVSINNFNNKYAGQILAECLTDSIIINPKSGDEYYIYHPTQKLWIKYTRKLLETNICSSLLEFIFRHYLKTNNPQEKKNIQYYHKMWSTIIYQTILGLCWIDINFAVR